MRQELHDYRKRVMTLAQWQSKADRIQNEIDGAIGRFDPKGCQDAVNWADLGCIDVSLVLTDPEPSWRATVSEAAPGSRELIAYLHDEMMKLGFDVEIATEW